MKKLDKDRFRRDLGEVTKAYVEIYERLKNSRKVIWYLVFSNWYLVIGI